MNAHFEREKLQLYNNIFLSMGFDRRDVLFVVHLLTISINCIEFPRREYLKPVTVNVSDTCIFKNFHINSKALYLYSKVCHFIFQVIRNNDLIWLIHSQTFLEKFQGISLSVLQLSGNPKTFNPIQIGRGGEGLFKPAPTLKICNFPTVKAITTKFGDFS